VSEWTEVHGGNIVASGSHGRVGEICDKINLGVIQSKPKRFVPTYEHQFWAEKMLPKDEQDTYIKKCEDWFAAHPSKILKKLTEPVAYDCDSLARYWSLKTSMPPIAERAAAMVKAGVPLEIIEKHRAWDAMMDETSEDRQKDLDEIFGKYANSKVVAKPKPPKSKMLKPVKKKMFE
jgi:hypothetical protein